MCFAEKTVQGHAVPHMHAVSHVMTVLVTPNRGDHPIAVVFDPFEKGVEGHTYLPEYLPSILKHLFCRGCNPHALGVTRVLWIRGNQTESEMTCLQNALRTGQAVVKNSPSAWVARFAWVQGMTLSRHGHILHRHMSFPPCTWIPWLPVGSPL